MTSPRSVSAGRLKEIVNGHAEFALLDAREVGKFGECHLLLASCLSLSRLEERARRLVPNQDVEIVVMDDGSGDIASHAAHLLAQEGYGNTSILAGGIAAWADAGLPVYSGVNVFSKAFGEYVYEVAETPDIQPVELKKWIHEHRDVVLIDCRPFEEFKRMNIPGSICVPGVELSRTILDLAPDSSIPVVVNCAGRTRSIVATQSVLNLGMERDVFALRNGTMGWLLAGFELEHGQSRRGTGPSASACEHARRAAKAMRERYGIATIDASSVEKWSKQFSTYVFDVRTSEEFRDAHIAGSQHVPGGQLVQTLDEWIAVRNAHIVLADDDGTRATMTASWLKQMGFEHVAVIFGGAFKEATGRKCLEGAERAAPESAASLIGAGDARQLTHALQRTVVVDYSTSSEFRKQHINGAYWALRRYDERVPGVCGAAEHVIVVGHDKLHTLTAAEELAARVSCPVSVLDCEASTWAESGLDVASGEGRMLSAPIDVWRMPWEFDTEGEREAAMNAYLTWEVALTEQLSKDGVRFRSF